MQKLDFRYACATDAESLSELQAVTFWETYGTSNHLDQGHIKAYIAAMFDLKKTKADIADHNTLYLLAEIEAEPVGFARLLIESARAEIAGERPLEISRIYLRREFHGKGFGAALLTECFAEAEKQLCDVIWLSVWEYNHKAIAFYESFGFRNVGTHLFDLAGSEQNDLIMQKDLKVKS